MRILGMRKVGKLELAVLLLLLGGGAFLYWAMGLPDNETESSRIVKETRWNQKGDYTFEEIGSGYTKVTNQEARFNFTAPKNWELEGKGGISEGEYWVDVLSPDAKFQENQEGQKGNLIRGCGIRVSTLYDKEEVLYYRNFIEEYLRNPQDARPGEMITSVGNLPALKTELTQESTPTLKQLSIDQATQVQVPFSENGLLELDTAIALQHQTNCKEEIREFLASFSF